MHIMQKLNILTCSIDELLFSNNIDLETDVVINGWVRTRRDSKAGISFITINDGSCFQSLQVVVQNNIDGYHSMILRLTAGSSVSVIGKLVTSSAQGQKVELHATKIEVFGFVDDPDTYPISSKYHTVEYLREYAHLRPRTNFFGAISRIRHCISMV